MSDINGAFFCHVRPLPCHVQAFFCHVRACPGHLFLDSRAKHGNDRGEEKNTGMTVLFFSVILGQAQRVPGIFGYSGHTLSVTLRLDVRGKPEHDRKKNKHGNDNIIFLCLTFNIVAFLCDKNKSGFNNS